MDGRLSSDNSSQVSKFAEVLTAFPERIDVLSETHGHLPVDGSAGQMDRALADELDAHSDPIAHSQFLLGNASDHMEAMRRSIEGKTLTFSPLSIPRSIFETTATAAWITDIAISPLERFARNSTLLLANADEQIKLIDASEMRSAQVRAGRERTVNRRREIEGAVGKTAVVERRNKSGKVISFVAGNVSITGRIEAAFGKSIYYRLLSTGAHHPLSLMGDMIQAPTAIEGFSELLPDLKKVYWVIGRSLDWYAQAWWRRWILLGWPTAEITELLERTYDSMAVGESGRFWR